MARTKASVISGEVTETSNKDKKKSQKRKDRSETPDTHKKKKVKKEEIADDESDGEELSCDSLPEVAQQFYRGTTWPLDASLEVHVQYEGVKEARTIKPQFFPLLFQLTRGDPDSIAKAITANKPVYKILTERFEKEHKASETGSISPTLKSEATVSQSMNSTQANVPKKIPNYRFRDKKGKWLPKSQWKGAEIVKKNPKLQSLLSGIESSKETEEITELCDAKAAIENILSRVTFKRQCYARLLVWMRNLEMKSYGSPKQKQKSAEPKHPQKKEKKPEAKKTKEVNNKKTVSGPKSALYGLEESAILNDKRLRDRPKFVPFVPPKQNEGRNKERIQSSSPKKMMSYSPQSAAMKKYVNQASSYAVQQSKSSRSLNEKSGSSRGYSVLFKGRTFSSGKKIFFNRNRNSQSESDSESKYDESDSSSTTSSYIHDGRKNVSRSWEHQNDGSKSKRTIMSKAHWNSLSANSSELGQCENRFLSDSSENLDEEISVGKRDIKSFALSPKVRVSKLRLSDVKMSTSSPQEQKKSVSVNYSDVQSSQENKSWDKTHSQQNEALVDADCQKCEVLIEADSQQNEVYIDNAQQSEVLIEADSQQNEVYIDTAQQSEVLIDAASQQDQVLVDTSQENKVSELMISEVKSLAPQIPVNEVEELPKLLYFGDEVSSTPKEQVNHGELFVDNGEQKAGSSTNNEKSKDSSNSSQPSTAEETLRLLISQLTNLTKDKGEALDCKLVFSNSNQVLSIGERSNSQGEPRVDIKPNIDEIRLKENPTMTAGSEKVRNSNSSVVRVKDERVESNTQWAGLRTQNEAEPIIVIDSDDE